MSRAWIEAGAAGPVSSRVSGSPEDCGERAVPAPTAANSSERKTSYCLGPACQCWSRGRNGAILYRQPSGQDLGGLQTHRGVSPQILTSPWGFASRACGWAGRRGPLPGGKPGKGHGATTPSWAPFSVNFLHLGTSSLGSMLQFNEGFHPPVPGTWLGNQ